MTGTDSGGRRKLASVSFLPWVRDDSSSAETDDAAVTAEAGAAEAGAAEVGYVDVDADAEFDRVDCLVVQSLRRRGLSVWEVTELLRQNGVPESDFAGWTGRYECLGYLDDDSLAQQLVATHHGRKGLGKSAVSQELKRRHIEPAIIEQALAVIGDDDELERATEIAVKRAGQLASYDKETASRRLHGFMMRKGYSSDVVRRAIDVAMAERLGGRGGTGGVQFR